MAKQIMPRFSFSWSTALSQAVVRRLGWQTLAFRIGLAVLVEPCARAFLVGSGLASAHSQLESYSSFGCDDGRSPPVHLPKERLLTPFFNAASSLYFISSHDTYQNATLLDWDPSIWLPHQKIRSPQQNR